MRHEQIRIISIKTLAGGKLDEPVIVFGRGCQVLGLVNCLRLIRQACGQQLLALCHNYVST